MFKNLKIRAMVVIFLLVLMVVSLAACNSSTDQTSPSPSGQQSSAGQPPAQGQQPPQRMNGGGTETMLAKVAEILGVSVNQVTSAFQEAQASVFPDRPHQGQAPEPGQQPSQGLPPGQGQEPPAPREAPEMTALYEKMAEILGISADKVSGAFAQAQQALRK